MIGGYMSFSGIGGRARYGTSPIADVLPVVLSDTDDRVEVPEGFVATVTATGHAALTDVPTPWPPLLGYNRFRAKDDSETLVRRGEDPILVVGGSGAGRTAAFASIWHRIGRRRSSSTGTATRGCGSRSSPGSEARPSRHRNALLAWRALSYAGDDPPGGHRARTNNSGSRRVTRVRVRTGAKRPEPPSGDARLDPRSGSLSRRRDP